MNTTVTDRIRTLLGDYNISPSHFADEILALRSSISHVLSGRNNPSLELIQKILVKYPEINPGWLLTGNGNMKQLNLFGEEEEVLEKQGTDSNVIEKPPIVKKPIIQQAHSPVIEPPLNLAENEPDQLMNVLSSMPEDKKIEKILVFYTDKTFSIYKPE
jgi:transcriptional regulator with XRE-family HTH domain